MLKVTDDQSGVSSGVVSEQAGVVGSGKAKEKKEHLTKAQKRRLYNRLDNKGEYPRGHDWVDIIRHLSQTGGQNS